VCSEGETKGESRKSETLASKGGIHEKKGVKRVLRRRSRGSWKTYGQQNLKKSDLYSKGKTGAGGEMNGGKSSVGLCVSQDFHRNLLQRYAKWVARPPSSSAKN